MTAKYDFSFLKMLRKRKALSIQGLCKKCGLAYGSIANLERNKGKPELETISKIADALGLSTTSLISLAENKPILKIDKGIRKSVQGSNLIIYNLNGIKIICGKIPKGKCINEILEHHDDYEICHVTKGILKITVNDSANVVKYGELIKFDSVFDHVYEALDNSEFITIYHKK